MAINFAEATAEKPVSTDNIFIPPDEQLRLVREWNARREWGLSHEDFASLGDPPEWPKKSLGAVVLEITLDTVKRTFEEGWNCARSVQPYSRRWHKLKSDEENLRLLEGIPHRRGLRWRAVNLAAHWDKKKGICPADVRHAGNSPAQAILWAAAYFPGWIRSMNGRDIPFICIPGYEINISAIERQWKGMPDLYWDRGNNNIRLSAEDPAERRRTWAVPAFLS